MQGQSLFAAAFKGTVPSGGACSGDEQCVRGALCARLGTVACSGACAVPPAPKPRGTSCGTSRGGITVTTYPLCDSNSYCDTSNPTNWVCNAFPTKVGSECAGPLLGCGSGLSCIIASSASHGTCQILPQPRQGCDPNSVDIPCDDERTYCETSSKTCQPRILPTGVCDPSGRGCAVYSWCDPMSHTCVVRGGAGSGPCQAGATATCLGDLACDPGTNTCALTSTPAECP